MERPWNIEIRLVVINTLFQVRVLDNNVDGFVGIAAPPYVGITGYSNDWLSSPGGSQYKTQYMAHM